MTTSHGSSRCDLNHSSIRPASSRCSEAETSSSIGSQDLRRSQQPQGLLERRSELSSSHSSLQSAGVNVGKLMHPETGAWANRTCVFSVPFKPLGLKTNQAPLVTARQDALLHTLRTNRLGKLRHTQALVYGVHDIPFTSAPAVAAQPCFQTLNKGRRVFPKTLGKSTMREIIGRDGRSPVPTPSPSDNICDRPCPAAASFLNPEGRIPNTIFEDMSRGSSLSPEIDRRQHTPNNKDRNCAGGSIQVDLTLARMFLL